MKRETKNQLITIFIIIIFSGSILTYALISVIPSQQQEIPWRARLDIVIFDELKTMPADIGVTNETKAKLYTLSSDNIIYKEGSEDATLGEFFQIWGENFNSTCILDYCNNENQSMKMYICSGCLVGYTGFKENLDYEYYVLKDNDYIRIDYR